MDIEKLYDQWSTKLYFDDATRKELLAVAGDDAEIRDRFYRELEFGTAGIRGVIGAGTNRINVYVVRRVSHGIAQMIVKRGEKAMKAGIVIGYDSRNFSKEFAMEAASVFAGNGIRVYMHSDLCPVPVLSYSIRKLKCEAGVMVTASHNPKEYNGYKAYGSDGAQIPPEDSQVITDVISKITDYTKLPKFDYDFFVRKGTIRILDDKVKKSYFAEIKKVLVDKENLKKNAGNLKLVYTPVHGAGAKFVPVILKELGFENLYVVEEQMEPNGDFPTVNVPNPENRDVYDLAVALAEKNGANLTLATDPDADRTGAFIKSANGEYVMLNGNQIGCVLLEYILSAKAKTGTMPERPFVVSTIVSTDLAKAICDNYGVEYIQVLTGFKFIGEQIALLEEQGDKKFVFGFEESYGYLAGTYARDKDAVASCMLLAEAAAYYDSIGMTLLDAVEEIYKKYGYYAEMQVSLTLKGESGVAKMAELMDAFRAKKGDVVKEEISVFKDIKTSVAVDCKTGEETAIDLPKSNVLYYDMPCGWFAVRPSGTEPKIKFYFGICDKTSMDAAWDKAEEIKADLMATVQELLK